MTPLRKICRIPKDTEKSAKQAFGDNASEFNETFLFGKLPIPIQHELSTAGKSEAPVNKTKVFIQRRFKYQQVIPQPTQRMLINEITSRNKRPQQGTRITAPTFDGPKISGDYHYCAKGGRKVQ